MEQEILPILREAVESLNLRIDDDCIAEPNVDYSSDGKEFFFELEVDVDDNEKVVSDDAVQRVAFGRICASVPAGEGTYRISRIVRALEHFFLRQIRGRVGTFSVDRDVYGTYPSYKERWIFQEIGAASGPGTVVGARYKQSVTVKYLIRIERNACNRTI